jgi:MATE family multidrug resistance protein
LGADALASVSLGNAVFFSMFVLALGFSFAIPPLVSEAHSKHDHKTINSVFSHGFIINMTVGILLMGILLWECRCFINPDSREDHSGYG